MPGDEERVTRSGRRGFEGGVEDVTGAVWCLLATVDVNDGFEAVVVSCDTFRFRYPTVAVRVVLLLVVAVVFVASL